MKYYNLPILYIYVIWQTNIGLENPRKSWSPVVGRCLRVEVWPSLKFHPGAWTGPGRIAWNAKGCIAGASPSYHFRRGFAHFFLIFCQFRWISYFFKCLDFYSNMFPLNVSSCILDTPILYKLNSYDFVSNFPNFPLRSQASNAIDIFCLIYLAQCFCHRPVGFLVGWNTSFNVMWKPPKSPGKLGCNQQNHGYVAVFCS